jgi:hypothetical protein
LITLRLVRNFYLKIENILLLFICLFLPMRRASQRLPPLRLTHFDVPLDLTERWKDVRRPCGVVEAGSKCKHYLSTLSC